MDPKASAVHSIVHTISLVVIVALGSMYLQLQSTLYELTRSCNIQRSNTKDTTFAFYSHHVSYSDKHLGPDLLVASSSLQMDMSKSSSPDVVNEKEIFSGTKLSGGAISESISISESLFHDNHEAFETTEKLITGDNQGHTDKYIVQIDDIFTERKLIVDEFGKSKMDQHTITRNSDNSISPSETSFVHQINIKAPEVSTKLLKEDDYKLREDLEHAEDVFLPQPQSTQETHEGKKDIVLNTYDSIENKGLNRPTLVYHSETEKVSISEQDLLDRDCLPVSKTRDYLTQVVSNQPVAEKLNFGFTDTNEREDAKTFTFSTRQLNERDHFNDGKYCESDFCSEISEEEELIQGSKRNLDKPETYLNKPWTLFKQADTANIKRLLLHGTGAWCRTLHGEFQTCSFQNLCYMTAEQDFVFLKSEASLLESHVTTNHKIVSEMLAMNLSTVPDHNAHKFSLVTIPSDSLRQFSVAVMEQRSLVMSRFKPDNIMHALHDDVIPLFHTLNILNFQYNNGKSDVGLLFSDHFEGGDFINLYSALSRVPPVSLQELNQIADVVCFDDIHIGLSPSTLWYQYGFHKPQGPLPVNGSEVLENTRKVSNYLAEYFFTDCPLCGNGKYLVLLSRKDNRLILNEGELIMAIARVTKLKVMSVSLETHTLGEVITIIRKSRGLIGMHGSLLSLIIFLQPQSIVIELFPYAVNPLNYTPFKTFCDFPDSGIIYKSWVNNNKDKSEPHPDWSPAMGGIHHLSQDIQMTVLSQTEVPEHLCCEDPSWLYHIYQDTEVDVHAITSLIVGALADAENLNIPKKAKVNLGQSFPISPGPIRNLICSYNDDNNLFTLAWKLPWNLEFMDYQSLASELTFQEKGNHDSISVVLPSDVLSYSIEEHETTKSVSYNVWVRVVVDHTLIGPHVYVACKDR